MKSRVILMNANQAASSTLPAKKNNKKRLLVVLGEGGHTAELLNLIDKFDDKYVYSYLLSKEDNLSEEQIRQKGPVYRITRPRGKNSSIYSAVFRILGSIPATLKMLFKIRPDAILSTGPAIAVPVSIMGKLLGARIIFVETGSRVKKLSLTGRLMYPWCDLFLVQWPQLAEKIPKALYAGFLISPEKECSPSKESHIFVTVGSTDFDDLIRKADSLPTRDEIVMQIGDGNYIPKNFLYFRFAPSLDPYYENAALVIAHGGLATTMEVLMRGLPMISVSNADRFDNHQDELLGLLEERGQLIWCRDLDKLQEAIERVRTTTLMPYKATESRIHCVISEFLEGQ